MKKSLVHYVDWPSLSHLPRWRGPAAPSPLEIGRWLSMWTWNMSYGNVKPKDLVGNQKNLNLRTWQNHYQLLSTQLAQLTHSCWICHHLESQVCLLDVHIFSSWFQSAWHVYQLANDQPLDTRRWHGIVESKSDCGFDNNHGRTWVQGITSVEKHELLPGTLLLQVLELPQKLSPKRFAVRWMVRRGHFGSESGAVPHHDKMHRSKQGIFCGSA